MSNCTTKIGEALEDASYSELESAATYKDYIDRLNRGVYNARRTGKYSTPETRIDTFTDRTKELIGKRIYLEDIENYKGKTIVVKTAEMVGPNKVSINKGEAVINLEEKMTTDFQNLVQVYGSEKAQEDVKSFKLFDLSGTVMQNLEELVLKLEGLDGDALRDEHRGRLYDVFRRYQEVLEEAGKDVPFDVEVYKALDAKVKSYGEAEINTGKMKLVMGNKSYNSMTELLAHELQHVLIAQVIKKHPELRMEIIRLREAMKQEMDYKVFLQDKSNPTSEDIEVAKEKFHYMFNTKSDEFLAYATTNEAIMSQLEAIQTSDKFVFMQPVKETGKWTRLLNRIIKVINNFYSKSLMDKGNAKEVALSLLDKALEIEYAEMVKQDKGRIASIIDAIGQADKKIAGYTQAMNKEYKTYAEYMEGRDKGLVNRAIDSLWKIKGLNRVRSALLQNAIFSSITRNLNDKNMARFYEMFRHSKAFVEREVVAVKNKTADILNKVYEFNDMHMSNRRAVKRVLIDTDAHILGDIVKIKEYLDDETKIDERYAELTKNFSADMLEVMEDLGQALVTNKWNLKNGYSNAAQIGLEFLDKSKGEEVDAIDEAISLYALKMSSKENKKLTRDAIEQNAEGIEYALELLRADKAKVLEVAYRGDKLHEIKGAKQEHYNDDRKHYFVRKADIKGMQKAGMIDLGLQDELSVAVGEEIHLMAGPSLDTAYTEGLLSIVQLKNEGDGIKRILKELNPMMSDIEIEDIIAELRTEKGKASGTLLPERDAKGKIFDYKFRIPHEIKNKYLSIEDDLVATIAGTVSNLTHKQEAMISNRNALAFLNKFYNDHKGLKDYNFVTISENSEGKFKEYWDIIPNYLKYDIKKNMGGKLMIEESLLVDFFGYSDATMKNLPFIRDSKRMQLYAQMLEKGVMEAVGRFKKVIVTLTPSTIKGNMLSNMIIALEHIEDKNPLNYIKKFKMVWGWMNDYQDLRSKKIEFEVRQLAEKKDFSKEIKALEARMKENPLDILITDGQYTAILEDVNTDVFGKKGKLESMIDDIIAKGDKKIGRGNIKALVDLMYVRKDSRIHDSVMKLTTYSDIVNKMIILMDMQEKDGGEISNDMLRYVDKLHVNYSYLDNKYIKYANDTGVLLFTKYFFRIMPAMINMLGKKPATVFLVEMTKKLTGINAETPYDQLVTPFDSLLRKASLYEEPTNILETIFTPATHL